MLDWLYSIVAQLIVWIHSGLSLVVPEDSGWAWGGAIFLLTVMLRLLMVPLFVKQIHASRKMQELNPKVQAIRKKYKNNKERMNQEVMKLYQENGANPLAGCLPLLVQMPVFIGLFQVLRNISDARPGEGVFAVTPDLVESAQKASIFGAHIPDTFLNAFGADPRNWIAIAVTGVAVIISSITTYFTMRASMKRQPITDDSNPMMQAQKMMVFLAPFFGLFGLGFPLGVLMYWVTSNTWTLVQQHYIYSKYPPLSVTENGSSGQTTGKGAPAKGKGVSTTKSGAKSGTKSAAKPGAKKAAEPVDDVESKPKVVRNQPTRKPRSKRSGSQKR
ncbi:membrane protein insertase YidC [Actinomadura adrarensis]|uniref:Membrane protein insertase YidC n=1 Tax=Actinomadura adrarensis TaxID=1819600 RepID=A0ABW3CMZ3_9ACTN